MDLAKEHLIDGICTLVKNQDPDYVLKLILQQMTDIQLQRVIQCILDEDFPKKEAVWGNPKRFTTSSSIMKGGK